MKDIINQVKSPFTDEKIKQLIEQYIAFDGNEAEFYRKINKEDYSIAWSEKNHLKTSENSDENTEIYRIYLNLNEIDKVTVMQKYVQKCEEINKGYKIKYSTQQDDRNNEVVIITDSNNLEMDIDIIEEITEGIQLGELPPLVGIYKDGIGIAEEYIKAPMYSYAEIRLDMIPKAILKYILDNSIEFIEYCSNKQVKMIDEVHKMLASQSNINLGQIGYGIHVSVVKELKKPLRQYIEDNSQKALPEMVTNYRTVCQAEGISEQGVFSILTEQKVKESQENMQEQEQTLADLQQELEKLVKQEKRTSQKRIETELLSKAYRIELSKVGRFSD